MTLSTAASAPASAPAGHLPTGPWAQPGPVEFPLGAVVLLIVLVLVAAAAWWAGPRGWPRRVAASGRVWRSASSGGCAETASGGPSQTVELHCSRRLDAQHRLHLVRWKGGELLLAVGPAGPCVIDRIAAGAKEAA